MNQEVKHADAPDEVNESLDRSVLIPNLEIAPEEIRRLSSSESNSFRNAMNTGLKH